MGLFDRFKKNNEPSKEEVENETTNEYKYHIEINFNKSETPIELVNKKVALFEAAILDQMTVLSAETSIVINPYDDDEDLIVAKIEFIGLGQFRFENEVESNQELENSFPLVSSNMGVGFWMKGGVFSYMAQELFAEISESELPKTVDISFYNYELSQSYDVQLEKDSHGNCRLSDWF